MKTFEEALKKISLDGNMAKINMTESGVSRYYSSKRYRNIIGTLAAQLLLELRKAATNKEDPLPTTTAYTQAVVELGILIGTEMEKQELPETL